MTKIADMTDDQLLTVDLEQLYDAVCEMEYAGDSDSDTHNRLADVLISREPSFAS